MVRLNEAGIAWWAAVGERAGGTRRRHGAAALLLGLALTLAAPLAEAHAGACPLRISEVRPVPRLDDGEFAVATQNLRRYFDDVDDGKGDLVSADAYRRHRQQLVRHIDEVLRRPAVLAVQEAENERVLEALAADLKARSGETWRAVLREGPDPGGIDVGYLVRADWQVLEVEPLLVSLRLDRHPLFDRPPLRLHLKGPEGVELEVVNVHLKSLYGSDRDERKARRIADKRQRQAEALADWLRAALKAQPRRRLVLLGDFNATLDAVGGVDVLGPLAAAGLQPLDERLPEEDRYTFVFRCHPQALDHILVSPALLPAVDGIAVSRGNAGGAPRRDTPADSPLASSDHDGLVLYLQSRAVSAKP